MAPASPPTEIILRVKVPPGHIEGGSDEFTVGAIYTHLNIGAVRERIRQLLPSNPAPERQRLLYGGRALVDNEQTLADALNTKRDPSQTEYVIHLLVKGDQANGAPAAHRGVASAAATPERGATPTRGLGGMAQNDGMPRGMPQNEGMPRLYQVPPNQAHQFALFQQRQAQMHYQMEAQRASGQPATGVPLAMPQMPQITPQMQQAHMPHMPHPPYIHHAQHPPAQQPQQPQQTNMADGVNAANAEDTQQPNVQPPQALDAANNANAVPNQSLPAGDAQHQGAPGRPVSGQGFHMQGVGPNGNRFEIHQQTLNIPLGGMPGQQQLPFGLQLPQMPGMGLPFPMPGMAQHHQQHQQMHQQNLHAQGGPAAYAPSALDRARQNVTEMRQMVDDMRTAHASEEERARMARLEEHINAVNDYIDPFRVGRPNAGPRTASPFPPRAPQTFQHLVPPFGGMPLPGLQARGMPPSTRTAAPQQPSSASDVTCYLLSSATGPQALLFSPQHGQYTGTLPNPPAPNYFGPARNRFVPRFPSPLPHTTHTPTPTLLADPARAAAPPPAQQQVQPAAAPAAPAAPAAQDPLQPLLAHFWLLFRVMIFAYFLLGANMGWRRPIALLLIGLGFWMIRAGLFGENGVARRWWEGIVHIPGAPAPAAANEVQTPEMLARRLMEERRARSPVWRVAAWVREEVRPVERAVALFLASLWPGVGEAHVRAREEEEERRRNEVEVERRRVEEEERVRLEEEQGKVEAGRAEDGEGAETASGGPKEGGEAGESAAVVEA